MRSDQAHSFGKAAKALCPLKCFLVAPQITEQHVYLFGLLTQVWLFCRAFLAEISGQRAATEALVYRRSVGAPCL